MVADIHASRPERRYLTARPIRTNGGPLPLNRFFARVDSEERRYSAASKYVFLRRRMHLVASLSIGGNPRASGGNMQTECRNFRFDFPRLGKSIKFSLWLPTAGG